MEAGGVDPPSCGKSLRSSTGLDGLLHSPPPAPADRIRQGLTARINLAPSPGDSGSGPARCRSPIPIPRAGSGRRGGIKPPLQTAHWQLSLCQVFIEASRQPLPAEPASSPQSKPFRPPLIFLSENQKYLSKNRPHSTPLFSPMQAPRCSQNVMDDMDSMDEMDNQKPARAKILQENAREKCPYLWQGRHGRYG
jgi:hypothetical protein